MVFLKDCIRRPHKEEEEQADGAQIDAKDAEKYGFAPDKLVTDDLLCFCSRSSRDLEPSLTRTMVQQRRENSQELNRRREWEGSRGKVDGKASVTGGGGGRRPSSRHRGGCLRNGRAGAKGRTKNAPKAAAAKILAREPRSPHRIAMRPSPVAFIPIPFSWSCGRYRPGY